MLTVIFISLLIGAAVTGEAIKYVEFIYVRKHAFQVRKSKLSFPYFSYCSLSICQDMNLKCVTILD